MLFSKKIYILSALCLVLLGWQVATTAAVAAVPAPSRSQPAAPPAPVVQSAAQDSERGLITLGSGDSVQFEVYGQPDMTSTMYVGEDGTLNVPLAGAIKVGGLTPVEAARRVEKALKDGGFLNDPHVTLTVTQSRSQRVSVLGEVHQPGRYVIDTGTTVFDLLAQAGGTTDNAASTLYILRPDAGGQVKRYPINIKDFGARATDSPVLTLKSGDSVFVPRAEEFYIYGEVAKPDRYPIEPGETVTQAIAQAGGITVRGSERRVDIKRNGPDGKPTERHAQPDELVQPDDVIHVKESIF